MVVKNDYREIDTESPIARATRDAGAEAFRRIAKAVTTLQPAPIRSSETTISAKFSQLVLADTTKNDIEITLPSATINDIGKIIMIKLWSGSPSGVVRIHAPLSGAIDGNTSWSLNKAMQSITVAYAGNNEWAIVAEVQGIGPIQTGYLVGSF